jgi:hypothetical protein
MLPSCVSFCMVFDSAEAAALWACLKRATV